MKKELIKNNKTIFYGLVWALGMSVGGVIDTLNYTEAPSSKGSDGETVLHYEERIEEISVMQQPIFKSGLQFFESAYKDDNLSEKDIKYLTEIFAEKVSPLIIKENTDMLNDNGKWLRIKIGEEEAPNTILPDGYILAHAEYLDECKSRSFRQDLRTLDECTAKKHHDHHEDGPWIGLLFGGLLGHTLLSIVLVSFLFSEELKEEGISIKEVAKNDLKNLFKTKPKM